MLEVAQASPTDGKFEFVRFSHLGIARKIHWIFSHFQATCPAQDVQVS